MKKFLFIASICLFATTGHAQKKVYWIHGLGENHEFWQRYRQSISGSSYMGAQIDWESDKKIDNYPVSPVTPPSSGGVSEDLPVLRPVTTAISPGISNPVRDYKQSTISDLVSPKITTDAILIGHSTGGLIARSVEKINGKVKAIVTVGTPNQGAGIVTAMNKKSYYNVIERTGDKVMKAVNKSIHAAETCAWPLNLVNMLKKLRELAQKAPGMVSDYVEEAKNYADDYVDKHYANDKTVQDMAPGSDYLLALNNRYIPVPVINIYGAEDAWPVVRMAGSMTNRDAIVSMGNISDQTYDEVYFSDVYGILGTIDEIYNYHEKAYGILGLVGCLAPWIWGTRESLIDAKREWRSVDRYVEQDLHNNYSAMIGAAHYETRSGQTTPIYEAHDGLIANKHSQIPTNRGVNVRNVAVERVNHMEMSGHWRMKVALENILYNVNKEYGEAFDQTKP